MKPVSHFPVVALVAALALPSCVIWPHTSDELPALNGRIVDAATLEPIQGARIAIQDHPSSSVISDASGRFRIPEKNIFFLGYTVGMCAGEWPDQGEWSNDLDVTHPDYEPFHDHADQDPSAPNSEHEWTLRDIRLVRKKG